MAELQDSEQRSEARPIAGAGGGGDGAFVRKCLIVLALAALGLALLELVNLFLLVFASIVFATILSAARQGVTRLTRLKGGPALTIAVLAVFAVIAGVFYLFGTQIANEFETIQQRLPEALGAARAQLDQWGMGERLDGLWEQGVGDVSQLLSRAGGYAISAGSGLADIVLMIVGGIFIAAAPAQYRRGILALVPRRWERLAAQALDDSGTALHLWLRAQLVSMMAVGLFTGLGLWLLDVPAALGLALIAGLLDFIPFIGPIIAAVPAVILAFLEGPSTVLWTIVLYIVVQQLQSNLLQPMVQKHAVDIPPALLLFSVAGAGFLFGLTGVILSAPLTVVVYVLVQRLYVNAALGKDIVPAVDSTKRQD